MLTPISSLKLEPIDRHEVARYYLRTEIRNIVTGDPQIKDLADKELWRLLEALAYTHRTNGVFHYMTNQGVDWYQGLIPAADIVLTGMSLSLNRLIYSHEIARDPMRLRDYLRDYFAAHPDVNDDPEGLNECRPREITVGFERIMVRQKGDRLYMLDGSHRFIAQLLDGAEEVEAFVGCLNGQPLKSMSGDATFMTLRRLFVQSPEPEDRQAILRVTRLLLESSTDGPSAISDYWLDHARSAEVKAAGQQLLDNFGDHLVK